MLKTILYFRIRTKQYIERDFEKPKVTNKIEIINVKFVC